MIKVGVVSKVQPLFIPNSRILFTDYAEQFYIEFHLKYYDSLINRAGGLIR